jgi:hypothetical protein
MEQREKVMLLIGITAWAIQAISGQILTMNRFHKIEETLEKIYKVLAHEKGGSDDGIRSSHIR